MTGTFAVALAGEQGGGRRLDACAGATINPEQERAT